MSQSKTEVKSTDLLEKLSKTCRACTIYLKNQSVISIFDESATENTKTTNKLIIAKELRMLNVEVRKNDGLPQVICKMCFDILDNVRDFRVLAQTSQITLKKQFHSFIKSSQSHVEESVFIKDEPDINDYDTFQALSDEDMKDTDLQSHNTDCIDKVNFINADCQIDDNSKSNTGIGKLDNNDFFDNSIFDDDDDGDRKPRKCWYCYESFVTSKELIDHEREHDEEKYHYCLFCHKPYKTPYDLKLHVRTHRNDVRLFLCEFCGKNFDSSNSLSSHRLKIHIQGPSTVKYVRNKPPRLAREYKCPVCSHCFIIPQALERHIKLHDKNRKYRCHVCGLAYTRGDHLKRHINVTHVKEKLYNCEYCGEGFLDDTSKLIHVRRHFNSNIKCEECGKVFGNVDLLRAHKLKHKTDLTYPCKVCDKAFPTGRLLAEHQRKHTKDQLEQARQNLLEDVLKKHDIDL